jgi:hypothetical protein
MPTWAWWLSFGLGASAVWVGSVAAMKASDSVLALILALLGGAAGAIGAGFALGGLWDALDRAGRRRLTLGIGVLQLLAVIPTAGGLIPVAYVFGPLALLLLILLMWERSFRKDLREAEADVRTAKRKVSAFEARRSEVGEDELLAAIHRIKDLTDLRDDHLAVFEWAKARAVSSNGLFAVGDIVAEAWFGDVAGIDRERLTEDEWATICASYAFAISLGIEVERTRRDRAELPELEGGG